MSSFRSRFSGPLFVGCLLFVAGIAYLSLQACGEDPGPQEVCDDFIDNDGDGRVDCDDSGCSTFGPCTLTEDCTNGVDDDNDGRIDWS